MLRPLHHRAPRPLPLRQESPIDELDLLVLPRPVVRLLERLSRVRR